MKVFRCRSLVRVAVGATAAIVLLACQSSTGDALREVSLPDVCPHRLEGSRWVTSRFVAVAEYGRTSGSEILDSWGITSTPSGDVLVYDAGSTSIIHLDGDLRFAKRVGREGSGPGEFAYQRVTHGNWIAADDSTHVVLTFQGLQQFFNNGVFRRSISRGSPFPIPVQALGMWNGSVMYGTDLVDRITGQRSVETWRADSSSQRTIRTDAMPTLPEFEGKPVMGAFVSQADPIWTSRQNCVFISDGSSDWLLRMDLTSGQADTIRLPNRPVPAMTAADEAELESIRRRAALLGIRVGSASVKPTAPSKWEGMIVDPDGYIWLMPWRPSSTRDTSAFAWIVHPNVGLTDSVAVEELPRAFLRAGGYVAMKYDTVIGASYLVKYAPSDQKQD